MPTSDNNWAWKCDQVIENDPAVGRRLLDEVLDQLRSLEWSRHDIFGIHLAIDEALINAILHGNAMDCTKHVHFRCWLSPQRLRVEITDEGPGFDPDSLPDPTDAAHLDCPGGRGVLLMRSFMSRVEYCDGGNHVVLEKVRQS